QRVAVGSVAEARVAVLSATDLSPLYEVSADVPAGSLPAVAWGGDGSLYAGGRNGAAKGVLRRWAPGSRARPEELPAPAYPITQLAPLPRGVALAAGPTLGVLSRNRLRPVGGGRF